jgi:hypothetical protein
MGITSYHRDDATHLTNTSLETEHSQTKFKKKTKYFYKYFDMKWI